MEQDQFMKNSASSSVKLESKKMSLFAQRQREKREKDVEEMRQGTVDFEQIVGNVVERSPNAQSTRQNATHAAGFPQAVHRCVKQFKPHITATKELPIVSSEMEDENMAIISTMSQSEIDYEAQQVMKNLDSSLLDFLKKRIQSKYPNPPKMAENFAAAENFAVQPPPNVQGTVIEADTLETNKLLWMSPIEPELPANDKDVGLKSRFDLNGTALTRDEMESLPTHLALHHHGDNPGAAGYTLVELLMLARSTVGAQRSMALSTLSRVVRRNSKEHIDWLLDNGLLEWCLHAMVETMTEAALALDVLSALVDACSDSLPLSPLKALNGTVEDGWMDWIALSAPDVAEGAIFATGHACGWQWSRQQTKVYALDRVEAPLLNQEATLGFGLWPRRAPAPVPFEHVPVFTPSFERLSKLRVEPCRSLLLHGLKNLLQSNLVTDAILVAKKLARSIPTILVELLPDFRSILTSHTVGVMTTLRLVRILAVYGDAEPIVTSGIIQVATRFLSSDTTDSETQMEAMMLIATTLDGTTLTDVDKLLIHLRSAAPMLLKFVDIRLAGLFRMLSSVVLALCAPGTPSPDVAISMRAFVELAARLDHKDELVVVNAVYFLTVYFEKLGDPFGTLLQVVKDAAKRLRSRVFESDGAKAAVLRLTRSLGLGDDFKETLPPLQHFTPSMLHELEVAKSRPTRWLHFETIAASLHPSLEAIVNLISHMTFGEEAWLHRLLRKSMSATCDDLAPLIVRTVPKHDEERTWRPLPLPALWPLLPIVELSKGDIVADKSVVISALELARVAKEALPRYNSLQAEGNLVLARVFLIDISQGKDEEPAYRDDQVLALWRLFDGPMEFDHATFSHLLHSYLTTSFGNVHYTKLIIQLLQVDDLNWWKEFWVELNTAFAGRWLTIVASCLLFPCNIPFDSPNLVDEGLKEQVLIAVNSVDEEDIRSATKDGMPMLWYVAKRYLD